MNDLWVPLAGVAMVGVVAPVAIVTKYFRQVAEYRHAERMRAIEVGIPLSESNGRAWPALLCLAIGGLVPVSACLFGWLATVTLPPSAGLVSDIWKSVAMVGLGSVICGSVLTLKLVNGGKCTRNRAGNDAKPVMDPDAFDVAGRRG